jgi:prophage regulatory protein
LRGFVNSIQTTVTGVIHLFDLLSLPFSFGGCFPFRERHTRAFYKGFNMSSNQSQQGAIAHRLLRRKQVEQAIGLSRSTIYARLDKNSPHYDPTFPRPITLGSMSVAWVEAEIQNWIASRIDSSRKTAEV